MRRDPRTTILHLVHSLTGGGTERTLVALLNGFDHQRARHKVVTLRGAGELAAKLPEHIGCQALEASGLRRGCAVSLARIVRREKAAIIHARNTGCWFDALAASVLSPASRLILGFHGLDSGVVFSSRKRRMARLAQWWGATFATNSFSGKLQLTAQIGLAPNRITVLPNGVDLARFPPKSDFEKSRLRDLFGLPNRGFVIGAVGSLTRVKRWDVLIAAFAQLLRIEHRCVLVIVGDGPERTSLIDLAEKLGVNDRICWAGACEDVPDRLAAMDVFVSTSDSESMSCVLLEAMASALPVVATDVGDNLSLARQEREGLIVPRGDSRAVADAVGTLLRFPELRVRLGSAARRRAEEYSFPNVLDDYQVFYERVAASRDRSSAVELPRLSVRH